MALAGRAGLYAHELAHIAQRRMGEGARVSAAVWIREGHAAWVAARNRLGSEATYGQAFLAVDWLIERHSSEALHEFLRRIGRDRGAWGSVFATSYAEFVDEFRARLQRLE